MTEKVAIVTGGGRGIGRAICRRFARGGSFVVAVARSDDDLAGTAQLIGNDGGRCAVFAADVSRIEQVRAMVDFTVREGGGLDILVNNAGIAPKAEVNDFDLETFDRMIAVNVAAPFYAAQAAWPIMQQRGGGIIINLSSLAAVDPFPGFAAYGASKAFVEGLTRGLAKEGRPHGIRVYGIGPGAVDTEMLRGPFPDFPAEQCLRPEDVAELAWHLIQPACQYSVGQTIYISRA